MEKIRIVIADDHAVVRKGTRALLESEEDMDVVGEAADGQEAVRLIEELKPDVAILDISMPKLSGIEVTRRLKQNLPSVSVVLILDSENEGQLLSAIKSGASACLTKEADPDELVNIIRKVVQGGRPISESLLRPAIAAHVLEEFDEFSLINEQVNNLLARLSPAEAEILHRIADQSSIGQVCQALGVSEETIRHDLDLILSKLVANDHNREVIEAAQSNLPSIISRMVKAREKGKPLAEYITKEDFSTFKETLRERFKSLLGEIS